MKTILCYGDSNTWGYIPGTGARYAPDVRWPGVAQALLGADWRLIEEGRSGRVAASSDPDALYGNGLRMLPEHLGSHRPLDAVVLMLGTNDLNLVDAATASGHVQACARRILDYAREDEGDCPLFTGRPRILVVSPIAICSGPAFTSSWAQALCAESRMMPALIAPWCMEMDLDFLDAQRFAEPSDTDGVHMTAPAHRALGAAIAEKLRGMLEEA